MKIVIDISEEAYKVLQSDEGVDWLGAEHILHAVANGTPLPEGHGDLKDSNNLKHAFTLWSMAVHGNFTDADIASIIYNSPTIIEADKAESEG